MADFCCVGRSHQLPVTGTVSRLGRATKQIGMPQSSSHARKVRRVGLPGTIGRTNRGSSDVDNVKSRRTHDTMTVARLSRDVAVGAPFDVFAFESACRILASSAVRARQQHLSRTNNGFPCGGKSRLPCRRWVLSVNGLCVVSRLVGLARNERPVF